MKEKIGIEKLIELLNEYDSGWSYDDYYGPFQYGQDSDAYHLCKYQLVSKEYGFIKWLVENDKIDREKCGFKNEGLSGNWYDSGIAFVQNYDNDTFKISEFYSPYLQLLMLLSISDTPIEDLISYLK